MNLMERIQNYWFIRRDNFQSRSEIERHTIIRIYTNNIYKKLLTPTQRNSLECTYREEGNANDDSK